ncbi:MAG TPA: LytS/YhcK type 5TM receptor domain-containing protein, partial [Smithellaceae bacterium]|nr:LytS/YhcK type 5TM receptor domain-containing protein [Smithellaceae bacterium]HOU56584.1 LytS/YhcK type 5TM receptor domain-containing protein [Smithellaceae bacterium]HQC09817.1 LytS/YhcK type 5TM receptor domain-containing protein [Smithellaceae bacterium]HQH00066.1 LytS/YhcK type 5TM receptor domain-containing protein [Smithellaceae bacterium]HQJ77840.1 LytS/YhcK type 5TM receptor domain-containing protein [Smithellaceae bacterium]
MIYLDLIQNLALLVALSVVSAFIDRRWPRHTRAGALLQGVVFGAAAVVGMLRPLDMGGGLIFDGRSVMLSLCALFFGPLA